MVVTGKNPTATFIVRSMMVFLISMTVLSLMFIPKILNRHRGQKDVTASLTVGIARPNFSRSGGTPAPTPKQKCYICQQEQAQYLAGVKSMPKRVPVSSYMEESRRRLAIDESDKQLELESFKLRKNISKVPVIVESSITHEVTEPSSEFGLQTLQERIINTDQAGIRTPVPVESNFTQALTESADDHETKTSYAKQNDYGGRESNNDDSFVERSESL